MAPVKALVGEFLRMVDGLSGDVIEQLFARNVTQPDIVRWRGDNYTRLSTKKQAFVTRAVEVWREVGAPTGLEGAERVAGRMGLHASERVKTLLRWITHPEILPKELSWDVRWGIADAVARVDGFNTDERRQMMRRREEIEEALHGKNAGARSAGDR